MALSYERAAYVKRVAGSDLPPRVKNLLTLLATHYADSTGYHSGASLVEFAHGIDVTVRTAVKLMGDAKRGGWVKVESGGGRHVNAYQLVMPSRVKP